MARKENLHARIAVIICIALCSVFSNTASAHNQAQGAVHARGTELRITDDERIPFWRIIDIDVQGLSRTKRDVVIRELTFRQGEVVTQQDLEQSRQRLQNMGLFSTVLFELENLANENYAHMYQLPTLIKEFGGDALLFQLVIRVEERWTLLPLVHLDVAGDASEWSIGLHDINVFGHYFELGGEFERIVGTNGFRLWYRQPHFLDERSLAFGTQLSWRRRNFILFDEEGNEEGGFQRLRVGLDFEFEKEWLWWLRSSTSLRFLWDEINELPASIDTPRSLNQMPSSGRFVMLGVGTQLGRINHDGFLLDGLQGRVDGELAWAVPGSSESSFLRGELSLLYIRTLPLRSTFLSRLGTGGTTTHALPHLFYFGGLDDLRGFADLRFRGRTYWVGNLEYRIPSIATRSVVLHHVVFSDLVGVGDTRADLLGVTAGSLGLGIRLTLPGVYGLVIRVDYAWSIINEGQSPWGIGEQRYY